MGKTLADPSLTARVVTDIVHEGEKLILPSSMSIPQAIDLLQRRLKYLEEVTNMSEDFSVFPWDGAAALQAVLKNKYGWATAEPIPSFWGPEPPKMIRIATGPDERLNVPWGRFSLPNIKGYIETGIQRKNNGQIHFKITAQVVRMNEPEVQSLMDAVRAYLRTGSIYKGKAIKIRFLNDDGKALEMPDPSFIDTNKVDETLLVYSTDVMDAIEVNLFTPIMRVPDLVKNGIPIKRGVLLGGTYGTGKTLAANVAAKKAVQQGVTFIYTPRADELRQAIDFATQYQSPAAVVFCEDIDRALDGDRTVAMDDILNIIDGIDSKGANIMVVLTTNKLESINPAMLRPGRLDAVIDVKTPDARAVERLIRVYAGTSLHPVENIEQAARELDGQIPAVIAEVVKRAKLAQLSLQAPGEMVRKLSGGALLLAAKSMAGQIKLLQGNQPPKTPAFDQVFGKLVDERVFAIGKKVNEIHEHLEIGQ